MRHDYNFEHMAAKEAVKPHLTVTTKAVGSSVIDQAISTVFRRREITITSPKRSLSIARLTDRFNSNSDGEECRVESDSKWRKFMAPTSYSRHAFIGAYLIHLADFIGAVCSEASPQ